MPACDYCEASFDSEDAYLDHLQAEHQGELGPIDRRRVHGESDDSGFPLGPVLLGVILVGAFGLVGYVTLIMGGDGDTSGADVEGIEGESLNQSGDESLLSDVERFPSEGRDHVNSESELEYDTTPPTSGPHFDNWAVAGFYEETRPTGELVHSLEHGFVVVYYDPDEMSDEAGESLQKFTDAHTGDWQSVIAVPNPNSDPQATYVLTAWRTRLLMDDYDAEAVHAFLSEYLGRGPENPVR